MHTVRMWKKGETGEKAIVERRQRVLPWWTTAPNGSHVFFVRLGWNPIEFDKGRAAIAVSSLDKLPSIIDTVIAAVRTGELDEQLAAASAQMRVPKSKGKRAA